jgi:AsmA protein
MQIVGQLQGGTEASLNEYGFRLRSVADRAFTLTSDFTADLEEGNIQLPALNAEMLGFSLDGVLDAKNMQSNNGSITGSLSLTGSNLREVLTAIGEADLAEVAQSVSLTLEVSGRSDNIAISPLQLDLVVAGPQIANSPQTLMLNADTIVNLENDSISVDNFTLSGLGLNIKGNVAANNLADAVSYEGKLEIPAFNARNLLQQLNQQVPTTNDPTVLQKFGMGLVFNGKANDVEIEELNLTLDDTTLKGTLTISDLTTKATRFTVDIDAIDADRYLAPPSTATTAENDSEESPLEVDALKTLDVQGAINIGELTISGLRMNDIVVAMKAANGEVALNPVSANLYEGSFNSDMLLNVNGAEPVATINTMLSSINLGPLLQDFMDATYLTGTGNIQLGLTGQGADITSIKRNLNGSGSIALEDGVLTGVDVGAVLGSIETMIRGKRVVALPEGGETPFNNFSSTLAIQNGIVNSNDLLIEAPGWKVNGAGTLVNTINYNLVATVEPATATSNDEEFDIGGYSLPIACKGNINDPSCLPDAQQIITAAVTNEVQERLGDFLRDRLGGPAQQQTPASEDATENNEVPADAAQPEEETPSAEEELINRALDRLLR